MGRKNLKAPSSSWSCLTPLQFSNDDDAVADRYGALLVPHARIRACGTNRVPWVVFLGACKT